MERNNANFKSARGSAIDRSLRIAMLAGPWAEVPPRKGYGGTELVVAMLTDELVRRGHNVELFCPPGSTSLAMVRPVLDKAHAGTPLRPPYEAHHVSRAFTAIETAAEPFDLVHDHSGFMAVGMADRLSVPMVHTMHGQLNPPVGRFYADYHHEVKLAAISQGQLNCAGGTCRFFNAEVDGSPASVEATVINHAIDVSAWPLRRERGDYLLWMGRVQELKGPHRAIEIAQHSGMRLILAGPVHRGQEAFFDGYVAPHVDGDRISYVGEVGGQAKIDLLAGAAALLWPAKWCEPFGLGIVEALACGTPVLGFPDGAVGEIVQHGLNGFLALTTPELVELVSAIPQIDRERCRASVADRYTVDAFASGYERLYLETLAV